MKFIVIWLISLVATINLSQDTRPASPAKEQAATKTTSPVTVDTILERYVQAVGGKEALAKITSRTTQGTFSFEKGLNLSGETESYAKSPNKILINVTLPGMGLIQEGYDGSVAWTKDSTSGLRDRKGLELEGARLDAEFNRELKLQQLYPKMELKGTQNIGGRDAYLLIATPAQGQPEKLYFDAQTGLLVRLDRQRLTAQGDMVPTEIYYEDYRDADGIKVPFQERQVLPEVTVVIKYNTIKHNVVIDDTKFTKPSR